MELELNSNKPHRVLYHGYRGGKISSRVFPNRTKADDFINSNEVRKLILVQLASDKIPDFKQSSVTFNNPISRVPCEMCHGKHKRLSSDACCYECSGALYNNQ